MDTFYFTLNAVMCQCSPPPPPYTHHTTPRIRARARAHTHQVTYTRPTGTARTHARARTHTHTSSHVHTSDWDCTHARAHTHTHARTHARTHAESRTRVDWDCQKSRNVFGCCEQDKIETVLPIHTTARSLAPRSRAYVAPSAYVLNIHHKNIVCSHSHKKKIYIYIYKNTAFSLYWTLKLARIYILSLAECERERVRVSECAAERAGGKQGRVCWPVLTPHLCEITPSNSTTALRMYTGGMYIMRHTSSYI